MTYSPEKIAAFEKLEEAIKELREAFGNPNDVMNGWLLLTNSVGFVDKTDDPADDDLDMQDNQGFYSMRGQSSTLSYGMLHEAIRHYNDIQMTWRDDE